MVTIYYNADIRSAPLQVIWEHDKRNLALRLAGVMPIICPVADGNGVTGISLFDADLEDVNRIMSEDPGVRAEIFTYDIHLTRSLQRATSRRLGESVYWTV